MASQPSAPAAAPPSASSLELLAYAHTHWDREWYQPFERFRMQLADVVDHLVEVLEADPDYRCFTLDGQTIVLEDYAAVRSRARVDRLEALIRSGRIEVGPWYVLPDEFLVSGESIIRNLERGMREAERLGGAPRMGYMPDPFGHIAQLPQILRGFGIRHAMFSRGMDDRHDEVGSEFRWAAPDGSEVIALLQLGDRITGYANASALQWMDGVPEVELESWTARLLEASGAGAKSPMRVLAIGVDHDTVHPELPALLARLEDAAGASVRHGGLEDIARMLDKHHGTEPHAAAHLGRLEGELRGARHAPVLAGIFSARVPIKQDNVAAQTWIERYLEPLVARASAARILPDYRGIVEHAWSLVLRNHPHDSIGGCSVDAVHEEMRARTRRVRDILQGVLDDTQLVCGDEKPLVFNPHPFEWDGYAETISGERRPVARVAPLSVASAVEPPGPAEGLHLADDSIGNGHIRVQVGSGGSVRIHARVADEWTLVSSDAVRYTSEGDAGDEYDFCAVPGDSRATAHLVSQVTRAREGWVELELRHELEVDAGLAERRARLAGEEPVLARLQLTSTLRLGPGDRWLDVTTELADNGARDHRLRISVALPTVPAVSIADSHFALVRRMARQPAPNVDWAQQPSQTHASDSMVAVEGAPTGLALFHRGLHEYQLVPHGGGGALELTLLRCVGWLSRDDVSGRWSFPGAATAAAGPSLETPGAQCPGPHTFRWAIAPVVGDCERSGIAHAARMWSAPALWIDPTPRAIRNEFGHRARGLELRRRAADPVAARGTLHEPGPRVEGALLSAWLPDSRGDGQIMRLYNPSPDPAHTRIELPSGLRFAGEVMLDGVTAASEPILGSADGRTITGTLPPWRIVTLRLDI